MNIAYIDGENTKGRIRDVFSKHDLSFPDWDKYDFRGLFDTVFALEKISKLKFYRALPRPHVDVPEESEALIRSYRSLGGHLTRQKFEVIRGGTLRADYRNPKDSKPKFREKGVDVSLAVDMVSDACDKVVEKCFLVASDSDYQPAVARVKARGNKVVYVGFEVNPNLGLIKSTNERVIISDILVLKFGGVVLPAKL
jgi:NYN domain